MRTIGIDVGGTKVLGVVIDSDDPSSVLAERRVPTPEGGEGLVDSILEVVDGLGMDVGAPDALGVGVPGLVDRHGVLHMGPHLRHLTDVALASLLAERAGLPTVVDNDANCHAVAEHRGGAAAGVDEALVVTLGTGIGGGIITRGALLHGANGFAGEPGHMVVDPNGPPCVCGRRIARPERSAAATSRLSSPRGWR